MTTKEVKPESRKLQVIVAVVTILAISAGFAVTYILLNPTRPEISIERLYADATFTDDGRIEIVVAFKNNCTVSLSVEVDFETTWEGGSDKTTKEITLLPDETKEVSAILDANPDPTQETNYSVKYLAEAA